MSNNNNTQPLSNELQNVEKLISKGEFEKSFSLIQQIKTKDFFFYILYAKICIALDKMNEAIASIEKAEEFDKDNINCTFLRTYICIETRQYDEAQKYLDIVKKNHDKYEHVINKDVISELENELMLGLSHKTNQSEEDLDKQRILLDKVKNDGGIITKCHIEYIINAYRGVVASEDVKVDDILFTLPMGKFITQKTINDDPYLSKVFEDEEFCKKLTSADHCKIAMFLLNEMRKGDESKWKYYIDMLPKSYDNFPMFYTQEELDLLKNSVFEKILENNKKKLKEDYDILVEKIDFLRDIPYVKYLESRIITSSRVYSIKIHGEPSLAMVPYADLFNHKVPKDTSWFYDDETDCFTVKAIKDVKKGVEVYDTYGNKGNTDLLLFYGFTVDDNPFDTYMFEIGFDKSFHNYEQKIQILGQNSFKFNVNYDLNNDTTKLFLNFLRFMYFQDDIIKFKVYEPQNINNELLILNKINSLTSALMKQYKTSLSYDKKVLINNNDFTYNQRNILNVLMSEKKILKYYNDFSYFCIEYFQRIQKTLRQINFNGNIDMLKAYMNSVIKSF